MNNPNPKRAALYARVSTPNQEQEATIESQIAAIEQYAQTAGDELPANHYYIEQAVSGAKLDRPQLNRLCDNASSGEFEAVVCLSPDRLTRHYPSQWVVMDEFRRGGVELVFVNRLGDPNDPSGQFLLGMQGLFAEYERTQITERLRRGKLYRFRQGQRVHSRAPYGYRYIPVAQAEGGRWLIDEREAAIVERLFQWYTEEGLTITAMVDRLNQALDETPAGGRRWNFSTLQRLLKQPAYIGHTYYNRSESCAEGIGQPRQHGAGKRQTPTHRERPSAEWLEIAVPSLIDEPVWQRAQERLVMNQHFAARHNTQRFYLLRGLLRCAVCQRTWSGRRHANGKDGSVTYSCTNQGKRRDPTVPAHTCTVPSHLLETLVWEAVSQLLHNPTLIADAWSSQDAQTPLDSNEGDRLQARLHSLDRQSTRLLDAFQDQLLDKTQLNQRKAILDQQRQSIQQRLTLLDQQQRRTRAKTEMIQDFETFCQQILDSLQHPSQELQQKVIRLLIDHIVVYDDSIVIKHIIPTDDDCRLLPGRR